MSAMWTGPAYDLLPSKRPCSHVAPDDCPACDGTRAEEREFFRATPAERLAALRDLAAWRSWREDWANTPTDDTSGDAA